MHVRGNRLAGYANTVACDAIGLVICARALPGVSMTLGGFFIATAIIALPQVALGVYLSGVSKEHIWWWAAGFNLAIVWILGGPAVADWATPDFNIDGAWQYVVLVVVLFGVAAALWRIVVLAKRLATHR